MTAARRSKSGKASLVGGVAVGIATLALWAALAHEFAADTLPILAVGALVAIGIGSWIRIADL